MKIALIADTHFGVNKSSRPFADNLSKFLQKVVYPTLQRQGIRHLIHLGDLVDNQVALAYEDMSRVKNDWIEPLSELGVESHVLVGNHDRPYKNTNYPNAVDQLLWSMPNGFLYAAPEEVVVGDLRTLMVPWINRENRAETMAYLKDTNARVGMGHLELVGFAMYRGYEAEHGDDPAPFQDFDLFVSGHYHEPSKKGAVQYLGAPGQHKWSDAGCRRGFGILDTSTLDIEFIENPYSMFETVTYGDDVDTESLRGKFVKVLVEEKGDSLSYEHFLTSVASVAADTKVLERSINEEIGELEAPIDSRGLSSLEVINLYVDALSDTTLDKTFMKKILNHAYNEAFTL